LENFDWIGHQTRRLGFGWSWLLLAIFPQNKLYLAGDLLELRN